MIVVGRNRTNKPSSWHMVQAYHRRCDSGYEDLQGKVAVYHPSSVTHVLSNTQPVGWNYETGGSTNLHIFNNKILSKSDTDVSLLNVS